MRTNDLVKLSTRMFKTNPSRTWLTILGMGIGISAVVILVGLGFGLQGILLEQIVFGDTLLSLNVNNPASRAVVLDEAHLADFSKIKNVIDVSPMAAFSAFIKYGDLTSNGTMQGVKPTYFKYAGIATKVGSVFVEDGGEDNDKVILSTGALKLFSVEKEDVLGKKINLRVLVANPKNKEEVQEVPVEKDYYVKGVIDDPFNIIAILPLSEVLSKFSVPYYEKVQVRVADGAFLDSVTKEIVDRGFNVTAFSKTVEQANKIFTGVQLVLALFGGIALVVSSIGMFNTMTVTLMERTSEIGIMRTIGASPKDIKILFLSESVVMGFLGGVVGILIGVTLGASINFLLNTVASRFGGTSMSLFRYPTTFILFVAGFSGVVGFLTGVFPATKAASLSPLDAIRYK